ncbi:MAG: hypothetical protein J6U64_01760, partial [Alphaproteobacteria bacterium]|nr:hypothetical protein [Alphaproteobacteria bacterium]
MRQPIYSPGIPAKTDKSLEIATFSFIYKHLILSVYSVYQKASFSALHGLKIQKSLCFQCFCLGMSKTHPRERQMYSDSVFIKYLLFFYKNQCNLLLSRISMTSIDIFKEEHPSIDSYWRALILFGRNTAAYKFALSKSLLELAQKQKSSVLLSDLAKSFSYQICE